MPFSLNDIHSVGEILAFAARTEIMPRFRQLTPAQVRRKSSTFDLVTEADDAAEVAITAALKLAFPDSVVIGEESTHREPALLQTIADAELAFIVDPIDGTKNFASSLPKVDRNRAVTVRCRFTANGNTIRSRRKPRGSPCSISDRVEGCGAACFRRG